MTNHVVQFGPDPGEHIAGLIGLALKWSGHAVPQEAVRVAVGLLFEDENIKYVQQSVGLDELARLVIEYQDERDRDQWGDDEVLLARQMRARERMFRWVKPWRTGLLPQKSEEL